MGHGKFRQISDYRGKNMKPNGTAILQTTPWHSGKMISTVQLDSNGNPPASVYRMAQKRGLMITCREPMCYGIRWYAGKGEWK